MSAFNGLAQALDFIIEQAGNAPVDFDFAKGQLLSFEYYYILNAQFVFYKETEKGVVDFLNANKC